MTKTPVSVTAHTGFTIRSASLELLTATVDDDGWLRLSQGDATIFVLPESIAKFKKAVAQLAEIY